MLLTDSHCHLDRLDLSPYDGDLDAAIAAARARGVARMLCIGIDRSNAPAVIGIAERFDDIYASVGIHPLDLADTVEAVDALVALADNDRVIAIGETGLDYYYSEDNKDAQQESFYNHLRASALTGKPSIVHTREAREDTLAIIREASDPNVAGVLHCFTESLDMAKAALELNFYISFSGIITFKNAAELRDVVAHMPLERMLIETDSPYLAPVPYRGKKNEPKYVVEVAQCVADIKGISFEQVVEQTAENFDRLFKLAA
ncbi:MAG TPA: hydrolase TatD [Spongiibacteraceae bacterium]|nr:hydrolase TatD [Spongiibacteraceae bacterium]HCS27634.1 hydrolase TatD [Spongiibacteraceae bacterium]